MRYEPSRTLCLQNSAKPRSATMLPFSYRCPDCGWDIETLVPELTSNERDDAYQSAVCPNCQNLHSVNTANGVVIAADELGDPW
jgi:DNA-directed RNA polymerase subunit RPC12/RpoP